MGGTPERLHLRAGRDGSAEIARAAEVLRGGGLVVYPTETFYGLGCDPRSETAVDRLVRAKGRPDGKPLPLIVGRLAHLPGVAADLPSPFASLADRFWPGPLTLVLPAVPGLAPAVTAGTGTVACRWTSCAAAARLALDFGGAIVSTSANRSGEPPTRTADEAAASLGDDVDLILDGGSAPGGAPSTLLDLTRLPPAVLRAGAVPEDDIETLLGNGS